MSEKRIKINSNWNSLCDDVWGEIFSYYSILGIRRVCKRFKGIYDDLTIYQIFMFLLSNLIEVGKKLRERYPGLPLWKKLKRLEYLITKIY